MDLDLYKAVLDWLPKGDHLTLYAGVAARKATQYDLDTAWRQLPIDRSTPQAVVAYALLAAGLNGFDIATQLSKLSLDLAQILAGLAGVVSASSSPALLIVPPKEQTLSMERDWLRQTLSTLERFSNAIPAFPIALSVSSEAFDSFTEVKPSQPITRLQAIAREGGIHVQGVSEEDVICGLQHAGIDPLPPIAAIRRAVADGLSEATAQHYLEAVESCRRQSDESTEAIARSKAEQFLMEKLDTIPETAGRFRLNQSLDFKHGNRAGEADILAVAEKIVVEIDGRYFHLKEDAYRRDRRKDWLYQLHGYLVVRFLAEDVVDKLDLIVQTIIEAVHYRNAIH